MITFIIPNTYNNIENKILKAIQSIYNLQKQNIAKI